MSLSNTSGKALRAAILASMALSLSSLTALAATAINTFGVTATVQASCSISASTLSFGSYNGTVATATSAVSVTCTNSTPYNVGLSSGVASGPTSALLSYSLFSDPSRSINWGQTVGSDTISGTGNGAVQALTVYGQAPAGQYLAPGSYTDTITATITY